MINCDREKNAATGQDKVAADSGAYGWPRVGVGSHTSTRKTRAQLTHRERANPAWIRFIPLSSPRFDSK